MYLPEGHTKLKNVTGKQTSNAEIAADGRKGQCGAGPVLRGDLQRLSLSCGGASNLLMIMAFMSSLADQRCEHRLDNFRECLYSASASESPSPADFESGT